MALHCVSDSHGMGSLSRKTEVISLYTGLPFCRMCSNSRDFIRISDVTLLKFSRFLCCNQMDLFHFCPNKLTNASLLEFLEWPVG